MKWHEIKERINEGKRATYCKKGEIWWVYWGENIGQELNAPPPHYRRPVLVLRFFGRYTCLVVPLSTKGKKNRFHVHIPSERIRYKGKNQREVVERYANIAQYKIIDTKRMIYKMGTVSPKLLALVKKKIAEQSQDDT